MRAKENGIPRKIFPGFWRGFTPIWRAPASIVVSSVTKNRRTFHAILGFGGG
jgi:hypothetical protein